MRNGCFGREAGLFEEEFSADGIDKFRPTIGSADVPFIRWRSRTRRVYHESTVPSYRFSGDGQPKGIPACRQGIQQRQRLPGEPPEAHLCHA